MEFLVMTTKQVPVGTLAATVQSLPMHDWMSFDTTQLASHPGDPASSRSSIGPPPTSHGRRDESWTRAEADQ